MKVIVRNMEQTADLARIGRIAAEMLGGRCGTLSCSLTVEISIGIGGN